MRCNSDSDAILDYWLLSIRCTLRSKQVGNINGPDARVDAGVLSTSTIDFDAGLICPHNLVQRL